MFYVLKCIRILILEEPSYNSNENMVSNLFRLVNFLD